MTAMDKMLSASDQAAPPYGDVAFEPQSEFVFDDAVNEEYRNMQRNIATLNVFNASHGRPQDFEGLHAEHGDAADHMEQANLDGSMFFNQGCGLSPTSTSWAKMQSPREFHLQTMQSDILDARTSSVSHQFGQITPPDGTSPKEFRASSQQQCHAASRDEPAMSAKSERARNAANQRHAKAKKARKDSARSGKAESVVDDDGDEVDGKREKYREKNRLAAAKCRAKKKTNTEDLEESARHITATNNRLRAEERELRDLFSSLRHQALAHDPTQGCQCSAIHVYNSHKAQEAARTAAMGLAGMGMLSQSIPSPSIGSDTSGITSPRYASQPNSRTQLFSKSRQGYDAHHSRTHSSSGQLGFLPPRTASDMRRQSQVLHGVASPVESVEVLSNYQRDSGESGMDLN